MKFEFVGSARSGRVRGNKSAIKKQKKNEILYAFGEATKVLGTSHIVIKSSFV